MSLPISGIGRFADDMGRLVRNLEAWTKQAHECLVSAGAGDRFYDIMAPGGQHAQLALIACAIAWGLDLSEDDERFVRHMIEQAEAGFELTLSDMLTPWEREQYNSDA